MLEEEFSHSIKVSGGKEVKIAGRIDRTDKKEGVIRVIDYKTGNTESAFESLDALFKRDAKRNGAIFQTFHYAYGYHLQHPEENGRLVPGLMSRNNLFNENSNFGHVMGKGSRTPLTDVRPMLNQFGEHLENMVNEIFDSKLTFRQTTYEKACEYCAYKAMCRR